MVVLLGNHEVMNMVGQHQDVTPAIYATFADAGSDKRRESAYQAYLKFCAARAALFPRSPPRFYQPVGKSEWMEAHPLGYVEYREAFGPQGRYGKWLRTKQVVLRLDDVAFMHAGINPEQAPRRLDDINKQVTTEIRRFDDNRSRLLDGKLVLPYFALPEILTAAQIEVQIAEALSKSAGAASQDPLDSLPNPESRGLAQLLQIDNWSLFAPEGPLWFRGFATWPSDAGATQINNLMQRYDVAHFVVGHTVQEGGAHHAAVLRSGLSDRHRNGVSRRCRLGAGDSRPAVHRDIPGRARDRIRGRRASRACRPLSVLSAPGRTESSARCAPLSFPRIA